MAESLMTSKVKCLVCSKVLQNQFRDDSTSCGCGNKTFNKGALAHGNWSFGGIDTNIIEVLDSHLGWITATQFIELGEKGELNYSEDEF